MGENTLRYYYYFLSQPSRALYILLKISGTKFEDCPVKLLTGENTTDEFKGNVNRFKKVPAIIDGDFKLGESVSILRYFFAKRLIRPEYYPSEVQLRARIDEFLSWQHNGIRTSCSLYFRFAWLHEYIHGKPEAAGKIDKYKRQMERDLDLMQDMWLQGTRFLVGDTLTVADIFGACEVEQIRIMGYKVAEKHPRIAAWIEDVRREMHPYFDETHQMIYQLEAQTLRKAKL